MGRHCVCLVGPAEQENLALAYLAGAVEQAGYEAHLVPFSSRRDIGAAVAAVIRLSPLIVGLGLSFQYCVEDYLRLVQELRRGGYEGHITCGGHVPTFCYRELLRDAPGLDTVVRHEGERTVVDMLARLARGAPLRELAGLVWREGGEVVVGPPGCLCPDLDQLPLPQRRAEPFVVGGMPIAFIITARGCTGECAYCSIGAFVSAAGGPRLRLRSADAVAGEVAALVARHRVRTVFVQDDLFILPSESGTIERMEQLDAALRARHVDEVAFWVKGRPETITPAVLHAARGMGVIHVFLGVESASAERLRYLGRVHRPADNERAIELCRQHGIRPSFNLMLFDPDCTLEQVAVTLDFATAHIDLPWNVCRTEIYAGTRLLRRLRAQGRLRGDYRSYGYQMRDARAELLFRIARVCLHERAFAFDSLLNRIISLSFARQVHERFFPGVTTDALGAEVDELVIDAHGDTVDVLRRLLDRCAQAGAPSFEARELAIGEALAIGRRDQPRRARAADLWQQLHARGLALGSRLPGSRPRHREP
ncbi:MAG: B12-binding domain-containing radical SAM protein [Deltaproteobacteria bacterium]|nr:B12-binding domain-containing radical SAM protein [Deltaproteobacteria bacterium]